MGARLAVRWKIRRRLAFAAQPHFEHEKIPQLIRHPSARRGAVELRNRRIAANPSFAVKQTVAETGFDALAPLAREPLLNGDAEAALAPASDALAQAPPRQLAQDRLQCAASQAQLIRQRRGELPKLVI